MELTLEAEEDLHKAPERRNPPPPNPGGLGPEGGGPPPGGPLELDPAEEPHPLDHQVDWEVIHRTPLDQAEIQVEEAVAVAVAVAEQPCHITTDSQEGEDSHHPNHQPQTLYKEQILQW